MVICIIAFIVFAILGIGSVKYRRLAKEAFQCTFTMITLRPCKTNLDERIRGRLTSLLMKTPYIAKFFYKNFKILSWIFVILFFASLGYSSYSVYNLVAHGTCDTNNPDNCPFSTATPLCDKDTCSSPAYLACKGNLTCQKEVCGIKE
jgi:hypothetical protein